MGNVATKSFGKEEAVELFPHLYGGINLNAVVQELQVERDSAGKFLSIKG